ncbi:NusA-like transcription termination signal-binding factor [Candidatus Woesearchaeota archaeon]|nr:NusA-like transcription termination signal-binding factor [Candidatus Woesearchaeota archaeon]
MTIKYDAELLKAMSFFEKATYAKLKDCYVDKHIDMVTFVVMPGELGKAVGKGGTNVKRLEQAFKKRIKVVEYADDLLQFIKNMIMPLRVTTVEQQDDVVILHDEDMKTKGLLIGRNAQNLRNLEENVRRFFPALKEIKVV